MNGLAVSTWPQFLANGIRGEVCQGFMGRVSCYEKEETVRGSCSSSSAHVLSEYDGWNCRDILPPARGCSQYQMAESKSKQARSLVTTLSF